MAKIFIKKQKNSDFDKVSNNLRVDLRKEKINKKQSSRMWLFLSVFLLIIVIVLIFNSWFLSSKKIDFIDLIPEETVVFSIIDKDILYPQIFPFKHFLEENNFYGQKAINQFNDYLNSAQLNFESDIQPFFEKDIAFILLSPNSEVEFPFIFILKSKVSMAQFSQVLNKIEPEFKKDYNFSSQNYRQIKITALKSFSTSSFNYAYAQADGYFIISNSQDCLKNILNTIINK